MEMIRPVSLLLTILLPAFLLSVGSSAAFLHHSTNAYGREVRRMNSLSLSLNMSHQQTDVSQEKIMEATRILADWDRLYNPESKPGEGAVEDEVEDEMRLRHRASLPDAVRVLNEKAREERKADASTGRCMLGICASSVEEGIATLKSWVSGLELPRGLLHGADKDGVPLEIPGAVYIKYNSGGVYTFADIRKSQMGFDALWKPGDAMLEEYDGSVRGIYFQVELIDGEFRQYLLPLDTLGEL